MLIKNKIHIASALILAGALLVIRLLTPEFAAGTVISEHPVIALSLAMVIAGLAWFVLFLTLRRSPKASYALFSTLLLLGLVIRLMFFGSQSVYENDYKRYLWDGAVIASAQNPYVYSPSEIYEASQPGARSVPRLAHLAVMSKQANNLTGEINSPLLTTIYPPAAQGIFALAHVIAPFKVWGLQFVFLLTELLGLAALLAVLRARSIPLIYSTLYWLNPVIIFTTYNGVHMDVLLVAPLLAALLWAGRRPFLAAFMLALAAAVKIWPLVLAPVIFRQWRDKPLTYMSIAAVIGGLTALSLLPMVLSLDQDAGLVAYSANWTNSSFLFPGLRDGLGAFMSESDRAARFVVAALVTALSLWLGFIAPKDSRLIPIHLVLLIAVFIFLSPTGYPWYFIWVFMFLPLVVHHWTTRGLALLTFGAAIYYARFQLGEAGYYSFYAKVLLPIEFGIPLLVLIYDGWKAKIHA